MLQSQYRLCSLPPRPVQCNSAPLISVQHRAHVHVVKTEPIAVLPREHLPPPRFRHPLSVVLDAKDQITVLPLPRDCDTPAALGHLNTMLDCILHERL